MAGSLGIAAFLAGGHAVAAFEQRATQPPAVQTQGVATQTAGAPQQGRGVEPRPGGLGPGRGGPPSPAAEWEWWKDDAAKRELGLTDKVATDIDSFYQRRQREIAPFVTEYLKQLDAINQMTNERKVDEATYAVQVAHVESLRAKLRESRSVMLYHIYMKLSPDQYKKLDDVRIRHFQRGRGGH